MQLKEITKKKKEYGEEGNSKAGLHKMTDQPSGDSNGKKAGNGKGRKNTETRKKKKCQTRNSCSMSF